MSTKFFQNRTISVGIHFLISLKSLLTILIIDISWNALFLVRVFFADSLHVFRHVILPYFVAYSSFVQLMYFIFHFQLAAHHTSVMASRKTLNRRPRPQRATSNVFAMFDQAQIQVTMLVKIAGCSLLGFDLCLREIILYFFMACYVIYWYFIVYYKYFILIYSSFLFFERVSQLLAPGIFSFVTLSFIEYEAITMFSGIQGGF